MRRRAGLAGWLAAAYLAAVGARRHAWWLSTAVAAGGWFAAVNANPHW